MAMIFYGLNVAAFKIPFPVLPDMWQDIRAEALNLEGCYLPHNMQTGKTQWETAAIKSALGNWRLTDPAFYRHLPEIQPHSGPTRENRVEYMKQWAYTELASHCPVTTQFCKMAENVGTFMTGARFLKVHPNAHVKYHWDNTPHKEFRVTLGLEGVENEEFMVNTGEKKWEVIPMEAGEAWFVDISLGHMVRNNGITPRYRLGMQFYAPTTDWMSRLFMQSDNIIYAEHLRLNSPFQDGPI